MRKLLDSIAIRNLNTVQRSGYFATIVGCLILIVLHNPMSSYDIYQSKYYGSDPRIYMHTSSASGRAFKYDGNGNPLLLEKFSGDGEVDAGRQCFKAVELFYSVDEDPSHSAERERVENEALATIKRLDCYGDWFKPFSEWTTYSPLVASLGNVVNLLFSILAVLGVGCFWLFVFRTTKPVGEDD
jgi:hypothetical protein